MSNHQYTEFHFFPKLPPELRRMIWDHAVAEPRVVHTKGFYNRAARQWVGQGARLTVFPRFPPLHDACHEARRAFLESPGLVRGAEGERGFGVAWHPDRDFLMCHNISKRRRGRGGWAPWWDAINQRGVWHRLVPNKFPDCAQGCGSVRNIMLELADFHLTWPFCSRFDVERDLLCHFPNLRIMELVPGAEFRPASRTTRSSQRQTVLTFADGPVDFGDAWATIDALRGFRPRLTVGSDRFKVSGSISCRLSSQ